MEYLNAFFLQYKVWKGLCAFSPSLCGNGSNTHFCRKTVYVVNTRFSRCFFTQIWLRQMRFDSDMTQISGPKNGGWSLWLWYLTEQLSVPLQTPRSGCFYQSQPTWWRNRTQQRLGHGVGRRWSSPISSAQQEELRVPSQIPWRRFARSDQFIHSGSRGLYYFQKFIFYKG